MKKFLTLSILAVVLASLSVSCKKKKIEPDPVVTPPPVVVINDTLSFSIPNVSANLAERHMTLVIDDSIYRVNDFSITNVIIPRKTGTTKHNVTLKYWESRQSDGIYAWKDSTFTINHGNNDVSKNLIQVPSTKLKIYDQIQANSIKLNTDFITDATDIPVPYNANTEFTVPSLLYTAIQSNLGTGTVQVYVTVDTQAPNPNFWYNNSWSSYSYNYINNYTVVVGWNTIDL